MLLFDRNLKKHLIAFLYLFFFKTVPIITILQKLCYGSNFTIWIKIKFNSLTVCLWEVVLVETNFNYDIYFYLSRIFILISDTGFGIRSVDSSITPANMITRWLQSPGRPMDK
jgi:hypothetical protein